MATSSVHQFQRQRASRTFSGRHRLLMAPSQTLRFVCLNRSCQNGRQACLRLQSLMIPPRLILKSWSFVIGLENATEATLGSMEHHQRFLCQQTHLLVNASNVFAFPKPQQSCAQATLVNEAPADPCHDRLEHTSVQCGKVAKSMSQL
jgi:hypothetical protein